jgi:hypothetical protein
MMRVFLAAIEAASRRRTAAKTGIHWQIVLKSGRRLPIGSWLRLSQVNRAGTCRARGWTAFGNAFARIRKTFTVL